MNPYSNIKGVAASTYLAAVVDTGLGYLDEPIYLTLDYLSEYDAVGKITPRMIMSHTTGLKGLNRNDPTNEPYYVCKYDESTTLGECLQKYILVDSNLVNPPGTLQQYNNEPFDILAELAVKKTRIDSYGEVFRRYITEPLGMDSTTYDCPFMRSTDEKPHIAWGSCTTANDMAKWVQMLANNGVALSGKQILSKYGIMQMFSHGGGNAENDGDWIFGGFPSGIYGRCVGRVYDAADLGVELPPDTPSYFPMGGITGYGLGTMFIPGNYGEMRAHAGSIGGIWFVNPGRYSGYIAWNNVNDPTAYSLIWDLLMKFEDASKFEVTKTKGAIETWEEVELCGGHDVYVDYFEKIGIDSLLDITVIPPCTEQQRRTTSEIVDSRLDPFREFLAKQNSRLQKIL